MLRILLLRHGKALPETAAGDHARSLSQRGWAQAALVGNYLKSEGLIPDFAAVSDAARTVQTLEGLRKAATADTAVRVEHGLYLASPETLLQAIQRTTLRDKSALIIGHNPGLAEIAEALTGYGDRYAFARMQQKFPPGALAVLDFDGDDWRQITLKACRLDRFICPFDLDGHSDE